MGGAASAGYAKPPPVSTVFLSSELAGQVQRLRGDEKLLHSFLDYVKSGAWQDRLAQFVPKESVATDEDEGERFRVSSTEDLLGRYGLGWESVQTLLQPQSFRRMPTESRAEVSVSMHSQLSSCFGNQELCCLMMLVVFPFYVVANAKGRLLRSTQHRDDESSVGSRSFDPRLVRSPDSIRVENILHSCATHYDGEQMLAYMRQDWVGHGIAALDNHQLPISIIDTAKADLPFLYCNAKFENMIDYTRDQLVCQSLLLLKGGESEPAQWDSLMQAFKAPPHHVTRTWVTLSTKHKRSVLDLVAVAMVGTYAVTVHFAASPASKPVWSQLEMVDDLLLLLKHLVIPPPPPSWFAISSTLANRVANALPSPLSRRSSSTSGRQGSQSGERHSGRAPGRMLARGQGSISSIGSAGSGSIAWVGQLGGLRSPVSGGGGGGSSNAAVPAEDEFNQVVPM